MNKTNVVVRGMATAIVVVCSAAVFAVAVAQERTLIGAILDANCAKNLAMAENPEMAVMDHHTIECTTSEVSLKSGLVILRGRNVIKIDPSSFPVVLEFLRGPNATQVARLTGSDGPNGFLVKSVRPSGDR